MWKIYENAFYLHIHHHHCTELLMIITFFGKISFSLLLHSYTLNDDNAVQKKSSNKRGAFKCNAVNACGGGVYFGGDENVYLAYENGLLKKKRRHVELMH